ncbi:hypothetical protein BAE44_0007340, partial [Dichanthelium oligosanthes]
LLAPGSTGSPPGLTAKFLQRFARVSNLPPGFMEWDIPELFTPFGPLLMWDVPISMTSVTVLLRPA